MEAARTIAVREERVLWVGEGAGPRDDARTIVVGRSGDVVAERDALPFADGELIASGRRESGVTVETFRELRGGEAATRWNDEMFEFQRTPYDPTTITGRIFLRRVRWAAAQVPSTPGTRVLEIGCEAGGLLRHLPEAAPSSGSISASPRCAPRAASSPAGRSRSFTPMRRSPCPFATPN